MEVKYRDLAGRIGKLKTKSGKYETPLILPVINPNKMIISPREMKKEFGVDGVITNSYIIWRNEALREKAMKGIDKLLDFDGLIMTDSGAFQLMTYGKIDVTNKEIIEFQKRIGVDIGVILDLPGLGDYKEMSENLKLTLERAKEVEKGDTIFAGPVQGGIYKSLRQKCARQLLKMGFDYFAVGSVVPLLNDYRFTDAFNALVWTREILPVDKTVHFFGAGHPMMFAFGVALGADVFDSAAYAIFAREGRYLTVDGTKDINEISYLPCSCPVCTNHSLEEIRKNPSLLARHNLYVTMEEMRRVKEAIKDGTLWELLERRARAHPELYKAFRAFKRYLPYLEEKDPITKRRFFYLSSDTKNRVEVYRHKKKKLKSKSFVRLPIFGNVPSEVLDMYPFGQMGGIDVDIDKNKLRDIDVVRGIVGYVYGFYDIIPEDVKIEKSKKTGRIRFVYGNEKLLLALRASDYMPIIHWIGEEFVKRKSWFVMVPRDIKQFIRDGKSVFAKFVKDADERIRPGMEVVIVDDSWNMLATGTAVMSGTEMVSAMEGVAVKTRRLHPKK